MTASAGNAEHRPTLATTADHAEPTNNAVQVHAYVATSPAEVNAAISARFVAAVPAVCRTARAGIAEMIVAAARAGHARVRLTTVPVTAIALMIASGGNAGRRLTAVSIAGRALEQQTIALLQGSALTTAQE